MKPFPAPAGFLARRLPAATAWFRPRREKNILAAWKKTGERFRFSEVTRRVPASLQYAGRVPVYSASFPGAGELVVRPCVHGGWWGRVARDFYFGPARVRREVFASSRLTTMKIPTPTIEAVLFYPAGPFVRIEVVTQHVPDSQDLVRRLSARPGPAERKRIFSSVRKLLSQLHRQGVRHPDLNARNILLSPSGGGTAWLLDVDAVKFEEPDTTAVDTRNRNRLLRSLLKRARHGELGWSEQEVAQLWKELFPRK